MKLDSVDVPDVESHLYLEKLTSYILVFFNCYKCNMN